MKYKIIALSVASVIGLSSIVLSRDNAGIDDYLYGAKESVPIELSNRATISDNTFAKGDMLAFNLEANKKNSDNNKKSNDEESEEDDEDVENEEGADSEESEEEIDDSDETDEEGEDEEGGEEVEENNKESSQIEKNIKGSGKKRKSHDMAVETGEHGKSHNLLDDTFFYIPKETVLPTDGLLHTRDVGLAKTLRGSICVCTFFVSEKNWKNDQYHKLYKKNLEIAEKWLAKEAKKYGSTITFENIFPLEDTAVTIDKVYKNGIGETDPDRYGSFLKVLKSMGLTVKEFKKKLRYETQCENIVTNFIIDSEGRSYCSIDYVGSSPDDYRDYTWIFKSSWGHAISPGVIAHEMLHAFGAFDMYARNNYRKEQSDAAKKYYPYDIMCTSLDNYSKIDKCYVSPITAWKIGIGEKSKALEFYVPDGWSFD